MRKSSGLFNIPKDCHKCVINQAVSAAKFANLNETQTNKIISVAQAGIEQSKKENIVVQHVIRFVADAVIEELDESTDFDIYAMAKRKSNDLALNSKDKFKDKIKKSKNPLETGIQIAAAGNIIDFGAKKHGDLDLERELSELDQIEFSKYDFDKLKKMLNNAKTLLYICDNSGEIVFDMLFIEELKLEYPELKIIAVLREKPIINDATLEDAKIIGLDKLVDTISSGSIYPGTILSETTDEFKILFETADIIIAKGQGNFETLLPVANERLFFLLRIKCKYMAKLAKVEKNSLVLIRKEVNE